jgi:hypothetical protein
MSSRQIFLLFPKRVDQGMSRLPTRGLNKAIKLGCQLSMVSYNFSQWIEWLTVSIWQICPFTQSFSLVSRLPKTCVTHWGPLFLHEWLPMKYPMKYMTWRKKPDQLRSTGSQIEQPSPTSQEKLFGLHLPIRWPPFVKWVLFASLNERTHYSWLRWEEMVTHPDTEITITEIWTHRAVSRRTSEVNPSACSYPIWPTKNIQGSPISMWIA